MTNYRIYGNAVDGGPVDESTPLVTGLAVLTWNPPPLAAPSRNKFLVRAYDTVSGLEEKNVDSLLRIDIDDEGHDITGRPQPPAGLLVTPLASAGLRVEWTHPQLTPTDLPTGFNVYIGAGVPIDYDDPPSATVAYLSTSGAKLAIYTAEITGLVSGTAYTVGVRAFNAAGEEENVLTATAIATSAAPPGITGLTSIAVS